MTDNPFDQAPDPAFGALLREHLEHGLTAGFTRRVLDRLSDSGSLFDVLAAWARPGVAAALVAAALLGYLAIRHEASAAPGPAETLAADQPVDRDVVMGRVLGTIR